MDQSEGNRDDGRGAATVRAREWQGHFELRDGQLDFSDVTNPELRAELERAFAEHPALTAGALKIGRMPWITICGA